MVEKADKIWLDGKLVPWEQATVHVMTHTLHYGLGAFEGIRCYKRDDGKSTVFRLHEHIERLLESSHIVTIPVEYTRDELVEACLATLRANKLDECYLRPLVFLGDGAMGLGATTNPTRVAITAFRWGAYLGDDGLKNGIRAKVSSFSRAGVNAMLAKGKIVGYYVASILAKREVLRGGYQEAIMLDPQGYVAEASGENVFVVRHGTVVTPPLGSPILAGITRDTVLTLAADLGIPVVERPIARDELYVADELFFSGTAAEITPVREVDDRKVGSGGAGPITKRLQERFFQVVRGKEPLHPEWLTPV